MIRLMKLEDKEEILSMMNVFYHSPAVHSNGFDEIYEEDFNQCISNNPYIEGYVFEEEEIMGYAMIAKSFSTEFGKPCLWIEDLYMKENYRGKGLGKQFFDFIQDKYKDVVFRLEVEEDNEVAVHLYKKQGFEMLPYQEMKK